MSNQTDPTDPYDPVTRVKNIYLASGIGIGVLAGIVIGVFTSHVGTGLIYSVPAGMLAGLILGNLRSKSKKS
ncbi:Uncharacterised protein [Chlamydia abortus]|uniref:Glycine zipper family protein n=1 Tax=Paenibacillus residui TaxID=629724 RepID=A0ABW3D5W9_9BACL|nr:hypothetical protein [Paenibacillus sp. 32O-W]SHE11195.1 Uncharacterised protein [Chlamydia abortus]